MNKRKMENKLDYFRKKFNKEMNFIRLTVILSLFIVFISGCKKDEKVFETVHPVVNNDPVQYDVPFNKVPETSDIAIYEVNLRAFSSAGNEEDSVDLGGRRII